MNEKIKELNKNAKKAAQLAKLDVAVDENLLQDFNDCLTFFVAPENTVQLPCEQKTAMELRKDVHQPSLTMDAVMANAANKQGGYIVVPRILPSEQEETP